ncbi:MAG: L-carnitine dehydratase/bile acid-inducible protein [Betaproteobacteria bacterium]|nr:L-carnitine dehydratase/bile acid-inducible protein [Betaproteobacteria bacterium]
MANTATKAGDSTATASLHELVKIAGLPASAADSVEITGEDPVFPTRYKIVAPGAACIAATGVAAAELWEQKTGRRQRVRVEGRAAAAAMRGSRYLKFDGKRPPEDPENLTGFYQLKDGRWIYLHCNFFNLRDRNISVLGAPRDKAAVASAVAKWDGLELENAIVEANGCACFVRSEEEWRALPQMHTVAKLPLLEITKIGDAPPRPLPAGDRPLANVRVLDLTRVLAGPTCARTLAEHGADVLRVTREDLADMGPTDFDTAVGKLCTHIDLRTPAGEAKMRELIQTCDVFSQSYRPGTLAKRGLSPEALAEMRPGIVYVTLSAWGHEGPWAARRGYDTIVQSANGMAYKPNNERPAFLPVSEQDYVAGYLLAYGAMIALSRRVREGGSWFVRCSLAGAGQWIRNHGLLEPSVYSKAEPELAPDELKALMVEHDSPIGRVTNLAPVVQMSETPARWVRPAVPRGYHPPEWPQRSA